MITPVLLSGGVGSRLWPVSRETHPKQFLPLAGELTRHSPPENAPRGSGLTIDESLVAIGVENDESITFEANGSAGPGATATAVASCQQH